MNRARAQILLLQAVQLYQDNQISEAKKLAEEALFLDSRNADALHLRGVIAHESSDYHGAARWVKKAIKVNNRITDFHVRLGHIYADSAWPQKAWRCYQNALQLNPRCAEAYNGLGNLLARGRKLEEAATYFQRATTLKNDFPEAYNNLGNTLAELNRPTEAQTNFERAIALNKNYAVAHWNLGMTLLGQGNFVDGWVEYEWRWQVFGNRLAQNRDTTKPRWNGGDLNGQIILLYGEQGLGDTLHFLRYVPLVIRRGGRVIVECQAPLFTLLGEQQMDGVLGIVKQGDPTPDFYTQCPLMSLPLVFNTTLQTIPADVPYLSAKQTKVAVWRERLRTTEGLKIGLTWRGSREAAYDKERSIAVSQLAPLADVKGAAYVSLQKDAAYDLEKVRRLIPIIDYTEDLKDFSDTAGLVEALDLVISVDTAVVHLAGAMGKETWLLDRFSGDWRWLYGDASSPWYPTIRIFRQEIHDQWGPTIKDVVETLKRRVS